MIRLKTNLKKRGKMTNKEDFQTPLSKLEEASIKILIGMMQYENFGTLRDYYASQSVLAAKRLLKECDRVSQQQDE